MDPFALPGDKDTVVFNGSAMGTENGWQTWRKPLGKSMAYIVVIGGGGGGGTGVIGANSAAAGGGGGGSGGMTVINVPLSLLPTVLYISVAHSKQGAGLASYISTMQDTSSIHVLAMANGGGAGGTGSGATGGVGGTAAAIPTVATMSLGWAYLVQCVGGQAGTAGGTTGVPSALALPSTGIRVTGGTGGGGLGNSSANGSNGGTLTISSSYFPPHPVATGPTAASIPATPGQHGRKLESNVGFYAYGGLGSSSTHGAATGASLVQAAGGDGGIGSGGGGMGGAKTGSTPAAPSYGGSGMVMITCY